MKENAKKIRQKIDDIELEINLLSNQIQVMEVELDFYYEAYREQSVMLGFVQNSLRKVFDGRSRKSLSSFKVEYHLFDEEWYEAQAGNTMFPFIHYMLLGWRRKLSPSPYFDPIFYQEQIGNQLNSRPFKHFLSIGLALGYNPHKMINISWYLAKNKDVARASINPLLHYVQYGWKEGRDPSPEFSCSLYIQKNGNVLEENVDPLIHFLKCNGYAGKDLA